MKIPLKILDGSLLKKLPKEGYISKLLPRIQEEHTRVFMTFAMTLFAVGVFGFFAISPTLSTIAQLNKQLDDSRFIDEKLTQKIANLAVLQQKYTKLQGDLPVVLSAIPVYPDIGILVGQIQGVSETSNVALLRVQTFPVDITAVKLPPTASTSFGISFDVQGEPKDLTTFLENITSFDRLITIDNVSVVKQAPTDSNLRMSIKGKAFFKQ